MKKTENKVRILGKEKLRFFTSIAVVVCIVLGGVFAFLKFYNSYIDKILYAERLNQMSEVTTQLFSGLEDVIKNAWNEAENEVNHLTDKNPETLDDVLQIMEHESELNRLADSEIELAAVDSEGMRYSKDGRKGLLAEKEYLISEPERVSFVSNSMISNTADMVYLVRLQQPVTVVDGADQITISYYGISQNMEMLNPYFSCSAYDSNNSVYVVDTDGLKLFSSGNRDLVYGYNVFSALKKLEYLHNSSFEETLAQLEENGTAYSNAVMNGEEIYYAFYHMENAQWTLIFMVPSAYVATNTVQLVNTTIRLVLVFAAFMLVVSGSFIFGILKRQQKQAVEAERRNSLELEKLNRDLEKAVQEADAANKAKSDFLANMSHDIRTPMNAIVGITGLMEHEAGISDKLHNYIEKVQLSSKHLLGLINDILDMSRIESSEVTLNVENVSLAEQIGQIDSMIRAQTNEHKQNFHIHVNEIVHEYLICDGVRLRQIMLNLLSNAVKYTPQGGEIQVQSEIGKGSRFEIILTLPIDKERSCILEAERILLVSDEERLVRNVKASMSEASVEFHSVATEEEARGWLSRENMDVVLLSGCVQNKTLKETVDFLRKTTQNATLIFCVDYVIDEKKQEEIAESGVDGIIYRPFFLSNLEMTIARTKTNSAVGSENASVLKGMKFLCAEDNELNAEILREILS
ncbi:histidine kinase dimerization/phospho-acceptor domain-containing protein [Blautia sp. Sow4_E7]|uniref:sensor histidine kinase n=1 Tax=Blautia sp. Sow4_E7 TaxID=3438749 RepID=UPI003F8E64CA